MKIWTEALIITLAGCTLACAPAADDGVADEAEETGSDEANDTDTDETDETETDADETDDTGAAAECVAQDVSLNGACDSTFLWNGAKCVETCMESEEASPSDVECFESHEHCIAPAICDLGPVGTTMVGYESSEITLELVTGVFDGTSLILGVSASDLGTYLFTEYDWLGEPHYPTVVGLRVSDDEWTLGEHTMHGSEIGGSWTGGGYGTVELETVELEGDPSQWRVRGQIDIDDPPFVVKGSFEVAGCTPPS